jgi:hypothetical protein
VYVCVCVCVCKLKIWIQMSLTERYVIGHMPISVVL